MTFRPIPLLAAAALAALAALAAGCSSDDPNDVGASLGTIAVDTVLAPVDLDLPVAYSALEVADPGVPLSRQQVLYLGGRNGTHSSILVNIDFGSVVNEDLPDTLFRASNIRSVKFSLTKLTHFTQAADTSAQVPQIYYHIHELAAPFDSTAFPGAVPNYDGRELNADYLLEQGDEPLIPLYNADFVDWMAAADTVGFLLTAGAESDSGLVGFAARDLVRYGEIPAVAAGTIPGPNLVVSLAVPDTTVLIRSCADIATFDAISPPPSDAADGMLLRTGLRQYPALRFDLGRLPRGAYINRAVLTVHNDTTRSFGTLQTVVVSELDSTEFGDPLRTLTVDELGAAVYPITFLANLEPGRVQSLGFNVTNSVQRAVNGAYEGLRGFVLTADEDVFDGVFVLWPYLTIDPDFYFNEFRFYGTSAGDDLRPRLQISYSIHVPQEADHD